MLLRFLSAEQDFTFCCFQIFKYLENRKYQKMYQMCFCVSTKLQKSNLRIWLHFQGPRCRPSCFSRPIDEQEVVPDLGSKLFGRTSQTYKRVMLFSFLHRKEKLCRQHVFSLTPIEVRMLLSDELKFSFCSCFISVLSIVPSRGRRL